MKESDQGGFFVRLCFLLTLEVRTTNSSHLPSYTARDCTPRDGTSTHGARPSNINNQRKNDTGILTQDSLIETMSQSRIPLPMSCVKLKKRVARSL